MSAHEFAKMKWWYDFRSEILNADTEKVQSYIGNQQKHFSSLTKKWNDQLNTDWTCRVFFSMKMIWAATLMLGSLEHARQSNLRVCIPYLQYYALLYSLRSLFLMLPHQKWNGGKLLLANHKKTISIACDEIGKLSSEWKTTQKQRILHLKAFRELISYRAPSSGGMLSEHGINPLQLCQVAVELAQMNSEILEKSLNKNLPEGYAPQLLDEKLRCVFEQQIEDSTFFDNEDWHRIGYLARKCPRPINILFMMTEGHVEDFFGSWVSLEEDASAFNPDDYWQILFNCP